MWPCSRLYSGMLAMKRLLWQVILQCSVHIKSGPKCSIPQKRITQMLHQALSCTCSACSGRRTAVTGQTCQSPAPLLRGPRLAGLSPRLQQVVTHDTDTVPLTTNSDTWHRHTVPLTINSVTITNIVLCTFIYQYYCYIIFFYLTF